MSPSVRAVGRVASVVSDNVLNSESSLPLVSPFTTALSSVSSANVRSVPFGADAGAALLQQHVQNTSYGSKSGLVSYTTLSHRRVLHHIIPHLAELSSTATVLHVAIPFGDDLSDVLVLKASVPFCLYSRTAQEAYDHALVASRLARTERKAVLHVLQVGEDSDEIEEIPDDAIRLIISAPMSTANGYINGHIDGHANGHATGSANGHINGDAKSGPEDEFGQLLAAFDVASAVAVSVLRRPLRALNTRGAEEPHTVFVTLAPISSSLQVDGVGFVDVALLKPLSPENLARAIPASAQRVLVCEHVRRWNVKWTPLFLEVISALHCNNSERATRPSVQSVLVGSAVSPPDVEELLQNPVDGPARLTLGVSLSAKASVVVAPHVPRHEASYTRILETLFGTRLEIANNPTLVAQLGSVATSPEYTLGRVRGELEALAKLEEDVKHAMREPDLPGELHHLFGLWLQARKGSGSEDVSERLVQTLEEHAPTLKSVTAHRVYVSRASLTSSARHKSRWIIGSDAWAYDLGASGLHHTIASGLDVNVLLLDTTPYSSRTIAARRRQDVGLYAMNHGDVYVASVALYSSYAQVLQALIEADRYPGPAVVLAFLPYTHEESPALDILKETKRAVDAGYWPLYRWNPAKHGDNAFTLDSDAIKNELRAFLDRQNHLSQLVAAQPQLHAELVGSLGEQLRAARKARAQKAYAELLTAIDAPPLAVLYASDGGKAEKVGKRLAMRARMRGLVATVAPMDGVSLEDIAKEQYVVFVTSVAGQGEFPQNGRALVKALNAAVSRGETLLCDVKVGVFGMGDSHYWPRPEDAHYYNKAGKDLDARLQSLGVQRFVPLGLGDDQDADGPETGYKAWEPLVWKALGVDNVEVQEAEPEPITNEHIKVASQYLRGTIVEGLEDSTTGALAPSDTQLTKFHGIYQQDDRDIRDERTAQGVEPAYSFMIRVRMPGGVCRPEQWLQMDQIADEHGCGTFKITTRQTFQFHGVIKRHLKSAIQDINRVLLDTLAACGDVNRNVIVSAIPSLSKLHGQAYEFAKRVSEHLLPRTTAYHEIWLDRKLVAGDALKDFEPLYGEFYLPRKFKIAVAVPPTNDVDVFANDVGFIAIVGSEGGLVGFNVTAGGGMGVTHGNKKTYPRLGNVLGFCTPEQGVDVAEKIMLVQRDNGNREDRKNARLKYTIDRMGFENFKAEVECRLGYKLAPARPHTFDRNVDDYGWHTGENGKHHFTCFVENGRIQDEPDRDFKTGLREIAKIHKGAFRLTANQHLVITDITTEDLPQIKALLVQYKLDNLSHTGLRLSSSACVAFPTCGLAMAESERYLPVLIDKVEKICEENGLRNDSIVMRMTGCPNGCARPYVAEVAFVGKALGTYSMLLGGGYYGQRLNKIYRETVTEPEILAILKPMIKRYALERREGERFGDFVIRSGYIAPTTEGKTWYDKMGGEGEHREAATTA